MATIALSAAGAAIGGSIGGSILGLSMATIGQAAGASIGRRLDQQILGSGSEPIETGRLDRLRLTGAGEGADVQQIYGRMRVAGQVIWASQFAEYRKTTGGSGKGAPPQPETTTFSYSVSLAIALCEGEITKVGRIWADGAEVSPDDVSIRVYTGAADQLPDPKIAAVEGAENTPAYRGTAYVVFEDLPLGQFGNRIPQFTFEVVCSADSGDLSDAIKGVALVPGTGEYALAKTPVHLSSGFGRNLAINTNSPLGGTDYTVSMNALQDELPACKSVVLVVSWFGDDLRCGNCQVMPKIEQREADAPNMPWQVAGLRRGQASLVPYRNGQPVYGGSPADDAVVEAIQDMKARGIEQVFYPFILMDQLDDNTLPDPWTGDVGQPTLPWRGRITTSFAPGIHGSPDGTTDAEAEVDEFMGTAAVEDFAISGGRVTYGGPEEWGYRRFILHYAHLCAAAGGVAAFCIGSEMRGLTQIRGSGNSFPAVAALRALAADVRRVLGPDCKISYAADWSEYHGYQPVGTADKFFHLDPLWADDNIDFIGVDNYMPLADWRDGDDHADAGAGSIYNLDYLKSNVAGGEGYDWYYPSPEARDAQRRVPITDGAGEPWVWRYKDLEGWWRHQHFDRIDGVRQDTPSPWVPASKPFWFTEFGCAALDKGANQPNKFLDPKSSESRLPHYSTGNRDDFMQMQYLRAMTSHYADEAHNPVSTVYGGSMVAVDRMHVWAWDARPYPFFPGNQELWADGENYARGHWLNGRVTNQSLASVVAEICQRSGVTRYDVSRLDGTVRGYSIPQSGSARAALQPLMLAFGFDATERDGTLIFENRTGRVARILNEDVLAIDPEHDQVLSLTRASSAEVAGRVQLGYISADDDYELAASEAVHPGEEGLGLTRSEVSLALTRNEGRQVVSRWIEEARVARDVANFALPLSQQHIAAGDVVALDTNDHNGIYRVDRVEDDGLRLVEATRIEPQIYDQQTTVEEPGIMRPHVGAVPVEMLFLDLPLLSGDETPTAPFVAAGGVPWPGSVAIHSAAQDAGYTLQRVIRDPATIGLTDTPLLRGPAGIWDRQAGFELTLVNGALGSVSIEAILAGGNAFAIGDGSADLWEIVQFTHAIPVATDRYRLSGLLRGQAGSRGLIPDIWPAGSYVVMLDGVPEQIDLPSAVRGNLRHFRYGPAKSLISAPSYRHVSHAFQGNGLRPYPVAHLRARSLEGGTGFSWIRCSRIDGDIWADGDIPLGEESERYLVRVVQNGEVRREIQVTDPRWVYGYDEIGADVGTSPYAVEVAQISARFGAGLFTRIALNT